MNPAHNHDERPPVGAGSLAVWPWTESDPAPTDPRPRTRGECQAGPRPCPWVGCRWHLAWEMPVFRDALELGISADVLAGLVMGMEHTCALDFDGKGITERELARCLGVSRQCINQRTHNALIKLRAKIQHAWRER